MLDMGDGPGGGTTTGFNGFSGCISGDCMLLLLLLPGAPPLLALLLLLLFGVCGRMRPVAPPDIEDLPPLPQPPISGDSRRAGSALAIAAPALLRCCGEALGDGTPGGRYGL